MAALLCLVKLLGDDPEDLLHFKKVSSSIVTDFYLNFSSLYVFFVITMGIHRRTEVVLVPMIRWVTRSKPGWGDIIKVLL